MRVGGCEGVRVCATCISQSVPLVWSVVPTNPQIFHFSASSAGDDK